MHLQFRMFLWKVERGGAKVWEKGFAPGVRGSAAGLGVAIPTGDRQRQAGNRGCWQRSPETGGAGPQRLLPGMAQGAGRQAGLQPHRFTCKPAHGFLVCGLSPFLSSHLTARNAREIFSEMLPTDTAFRAQRSPALPSPSWTPNSSFSPCGAQSPLPAHWPPHLPPVWPPLLL